MARIRTIKPGFFRSHDVTSLPVASRLTFIGLWTYVDDAGRGHDDARLIKADVWPVDDNYTAAKVNQDLERFEEKGLIERYIVDGRSYLRICTWAKHQKINRPGVSNIPASPTEHEPSPPPPGGITERSVNDHGGRTEGSPPEGKGKERKGKEEEQDAVVVTDDAATAADVERLCTVLADLVEANGSKRPAITAHWRSECERAIRIDGRTPDQIEHAIRWAQAHPFWRSNIMSIPKLRAKYDQLRLQAQRDQPGNHLSVVGADHAPTNGKAAIAEYRRRKGLSA